MTLDTLPALPLRFTKQEADGQWWIDTRDGYPIVHSRFTSLTADQAQALVSLVNSAGAMREALRPFAHISELIFDDPSWHDDHEVTLEIEGSAPLADFKVRQFRAARAAMTDRRPLTAEEPEITDPRGRERVRFLVNGYCYDLPTDLLLLGLGLVMSNAVQPFLKEAAKATGKQWDDIHGSHIYGAANLLLADYRRLHNASKIDPTKLTAALALIEEGE